MSVLPANSRREILTPSLKEKRQDITSHEQLRHPFLSNHDMYLAVNHTDDSSELHVDGGGEEGGCNKQQYSLDDVRTQGPVRALISRPGTAGIANDFHCTRSGLALRGNYYDCIPMPNCCRPGPCNSQMPPIASGRRNQHLDLRSCQK